VILLEVYYIENRIFHFNIFLFVILSIIISLEFKELILILKSESEEKNIILNKISKLIV